MRSNIHIYIDTQICIILNKNIEVAACFLLYAAGEKKGVFSSFHLLSSVLFCLPTRGGVLHSEINLHTRLATRASRHRSNKYMQFNSAHSEQDKGACAKGSSYDPTLPKNTQVHMWKKDVWGTR